MTDHESHQLTNRSPQLYPVGALPFALFEQWVLWAFLSRCRKLLQLRVLCLGLSQDGDVEIGIFP
jgi:hypothetical protein